MRFDELPFYVTWDFIAIKEKLHFTSWEILNLIRKSFLCDVYRRLPFKTMLNQWHYLAIGFHRKLFHFLWISSILFLCEQSGAISILHVYCLFISFYFSYCLVASGARKWNATIQMYIYGTLRIFSIFINNFILSAATGHGFHILSHIQGCC